MSSGDPIIASLELCSEAAGDITPLVYKRFFELCPEGLELMGHSDEHMQGRMLEQVLDLFFSDEHFGEGAYLNWELDNHLVSYRVQGGMYDHFFTALLSVVNEAVGSAWTQPMAAAWDERIGLIMGQVRVHPAVVVG
mgnify:CR=1 FL=1